MAAKESGIQALGLTHREFLHLAKKMYLSGAAKAQPLMVHGPPGIGKTDTVKQLAQELAQDVFSTSKLVKKTVKRDGPEITTLKSDKGEFFCTVISAPLLEPTDIKGVPAIDLEKKLAYWIEPYFLPKKGRGIILIDDITAATRSVVSSLLMLLQHRRILQYELPEDVMVMAAGNRVEDLSYCDQLSAAMRSRMTHVDLVPDFEEWVDWAYKHEIHTNIIGFLRIHGGSKYFRTTAQEMSDRSYPCPRTWAHASNLMNLGLPHKILREALMGSVGVAAGNEIMMYRELCEELPKIEEILRHPETAMVPEKADALYAVACAVAEQAKHNEHHRSIVRYAMRMPAEFQVITIGDAIRVNYDIVISGDKMADGKIDYCGYMAEFVKKHEKVLLSHRKYA